MTDSTHYVIEGKKYIRVTALLAARGLLDFSAIPEQDRQFYLDRGTANHSLWEHVERGNDNQYNFDPRVESYRAGHAKFLRETGFKAAPNGIELRVHATWRDLGFADHDIGGFAGIAGRLDRLGTIQGRPCLVDYKTTSIHSATALQTALYLLCLPKLDFYIVERYGVAFRKNGTYQMSLRYPYSDKTEALYHINEYRKGEKP